MYSRAFPFSSSTRKRTLATRPLNCSRSAPKDKASTERKISSLQFRPPDRRRYQDLCRKIGIGIEVGARKTFTDYLDDVSTVYPDPVALRSNNGNLAVALSDRSFSSRDTLMVLTGIKGKQRGNSFDKDWYLFGGITLYFRVGSILRDICEPFKRRRYF